MTESYVDCNQCTHIKTCKYVDNLKNLSPVILEIFFKCKEFNGLNSVSDIKKAVDKYPELSVDELSKLQQEKAKKDNHKNKKEIQGICSICGKESNSIVYCEKCGNPCCENCREEINDLDNINEENPTSKISIICIKCSEDDDL